MDGQQCVLCMGNLGVSGHSFIHFTAKRLGKQCTKFDFTQPIENEHFKLGVLKNIICDAEYPVTHYSTHYWL